MENNNEKNNIVVKRVIQRCGCDTILPLAFVYVFYISLHGHLSPGGGFQGGVLMTAVLILIYLGHGYKTTSKALGLNVMRRLEGVALTLYVLIALGGIIAGGNFAQNFAYNNGAVGALLSSGTISWMDEMVGLNVLCGVGVITLSMLGLLGDRDVDNRRKRKRK